MGGGIRQRSSPAVNNVRLTASRSGVRNAVRFTTAATAFTIPRGSVTADGALVITPHNDNRDNVDETVAITAAGVGAPGVADLTLSTPSTAADKVTLTDDDPIDILLSAHPSTIPENGGRSRITARLSQSTISITTITVQAQPQGLATVSDFRQTGATLTIPAGQTASSGSITIAAIDNAIVNLQRRRNASRNCGSQTPNPALVNHRKRTNNGSRRGIGGNDAAALLRGLAGVV